MVNYGAAFKLPFSNFRRSGLLFLVFLLSSIISQTTTFLQGPVSAEASVSVGRSLATLTLSLITMLLGLFAVGYGFRIEAAAVRGQNVLPPFENITGMIGRGLQYFVAAIIYVIPFMIVLLAGILMVTGGAVAASVPLILAGVLLLLPLSILALFFFLYIMPVIEVHFAVERRFRSLFALRTCFKKAFATAYAVPWLVATGYMLLLVLLYLIVYLPTYFASLAVPAIGFISVPFTALFSFLSLATTTNLFGQAYGVTRGTSAVAALPAARQRPTRKETKK